MTDYGLLLDAGLRPAIAAKVLADLGGIRGAANATTAELIAAGVPAKTAAKLAAAIAFGRRGVSSCNDRRVVCSEPSDVHALVAPRIATLEVEAFLVVALNVRNEVIDIIEIARGSAHGVEVHPREVFRAAMRVSAAGIVLCHNHPSGDPTPSSEDVDLTRRLKEVGMLVGIPVMDHVVVAGSKYRSLAEWLGGGL